MPSIIFNTNRNNLEIVAKGRLLPSIKDFFAMGITFCLTVFTWIFFRAESIGEALSFVKKIFSKSFFTIPYIFEAVTLLPILPILFMAIILLFLIIEWIGREDSFAISKFIDRMPLFIRWISYSFLVFSIIYYSVNENQFIYFQF